MAGKVTKLKSAPERARPAPPTEPTPEIAPRLQLRLRDVVERVCDRSGMRKAEARAAIEATMSVIGDAIENGEDIDLPGFGKLKCQREKETGRGKAYVLRLMRNRPTGARTEALAEDEKGR